MNSRIFRSAVPKAGATMWAIPIRFWETQEPIQCDVLEEPKEDAEHVYVYSHEYGHNVYQPREGLFFSRDKAIDAAYFYKNILELYSEDATKYVISLTMARLINEWDEKLDSEASKSVPPTAE